MLNRPQKITLAEMRASGVRGLSGDRWADDVWLSDIEAGFVSTACGKRGADVRPDFDWALKRERV
jgi:hypothetical protein